MLNIPIFPPSFVLSTSRRSMNALRLIGRIVCATWLVVSLGVAAQAAPLDPLDWPNWRGPEQNGISRETGLPAEWEIDGENMLWKSTELGTRSTPIVMNGKLYTLARSFPESHKEGEQVICSDA